MIYKGTMGYYLLYPWHIDETHPQNGEVSAALIGGVYSCILRCFFPGKGKMLPRTKIEFVKDIPGHKISMLVCFWNKMGTVIYLWESGWWTRNKGDDAMELNKCCC